MSEQQSLQAMIRALNEQDPRAGHRLDPEILADFCDGLLDEAQRLEVLEHLAVSAQSCADWRAMARAAENLPAPLLEKAQLEQAWRQLNLAEPQTSAGGERAASQALQPPQLRQPPWWRRAWLGWAVACVCLAYLALPWLAPVTTAHQTRPLLQTLVADLGDDATAGRRNTAALSLSLQPWMQSLTLRLAVARVVDQRVHYRALLFRQDQTRPVFQFKQLQAGADGGFSLALAATLLETGAYRLEIRSADGAEQVAVYYFEVVRP